MPLVSKLIEQSNIKLKDIDLIACDVGPGSFTGIRIGISTIKAIAMSLNVPVVSVTSLEALACNVQNIDCKTICSLIDARNNQVYSGIFDKEYNLLEEYINTIIKALKKYEDIVFVGDGTVIHKELLGISDLSYENIIHSKNIGKCAYKKYIENKLDTADSIKPLYLRKSQAERMKQKNG